MPLACCAEPVAGMNPNTIPTTAICPTRTTHCDAMVPPFTSSVLRVEFQWGEYRLLTMRCQE